MITVVGKQNCQACDTMQAWLNQQGYGYEVIDGMKNMNWMRRIQAHGARSFPQAFVDGDFIGDLQALQTFLENNK